MTLFIVLPAYNEYQAISPLFTRLRQFEKKSCTPIYLIFVDETGCNTNQLNDGKVGGELYIMPKNVGDAAAPAGATTDIHFTLLPFISGTEEPVLCAIIFKSDLHVSQMPVSWKTGIDLTQDANNINLVASGGPPCFFFWGKKSLASMGLPQKLLSPPNY